MLVRVYTCQNTTLLEITCHGSFGLIRFYQLTRREIKVLVLENAFSNNDRWSPSLFSF